MKAKQALARPELGLSGHTDAQGRTLVQASWNSVTSAVTGLRAWREIAKTPSPDNADAGISAVARHADMYATSRFMGMSDAPADAKAIDYAEYLAANGWDIGTKKLTDALGKLRPPKAVSRKRRLFWGAEGDELDLDKVRSGAIDTAWRGTRPRHVSAPRLVSIIVDQGVNSLSDADVVFWRGAAGAALVHTLENAGWQTEMFAASAVRPHTPRFTKSSPSAPTPNYLCFKTRVKARTQPLSLSHVAGVVCSPVWFRGSIIGASWGMSFNDLTLFGRSKKTTHLGSGCGQCVSLESLFAVGLFQPFQGGERGVCLIVPDSVCDQKTAQDWVADTLANLDTLARL